MIVDLLTISGNAVLAGATAGTKGMAALIQRTQNQSPNVVYLDFRGIEAATGSYLRESILGFRNYCRRVQTNTYPVIANASPIVEEEFRDILFHANDAFVACRVTKGERTSEAKVIGQLDQRQAETLEAVVRAGEITAAQLAKTSKDNVGTTAWNNRLAALAVKGILVERKLGRSKFFSPVIKDLRYGT